MKTRNVNFKRKQAGVSTVTVAVAVAVTALAIVGGTYALKYISNQKVKNEIAEITDLRASAVYFAAQHGGRYTGLDLNIACNKEFFPAGRCSGTGASTVATNASGGAITIAVTSLTGPGTGAAFTYPGLTSSACISEITDLWNIAARIDVGTTAVKTATTQALVDTTIINACNAAADDADIVWTFGTN